MLKFLKLIYGYVIILVRGENLDDNLLNMGKGTSGSKVGTGGMATKLTAAQIASAAGRCV